MKRARKVIDQISPQIQRYSKFRFQIDRAYFSLRDDQIRKHILEHTILPHIKVSPFINAKRASPTFTHRGTKEKEGWFYSWVEVVVLHFYERLLDGKDGTRAFFRIDIYVYISALGSLVIFLSPRRRIFMREGAISRPIRCFGARFLIDVEKLSGRRIDWWLFW